MNDPKPLSEHPLPTQLVIWAFCIALAIVFLAAAARFGLWIWEAGR